MSPIGARLNNPEGGQSVAELALVVPLFAIALLFILNILTFVHGATVFDRAVEQWVRAEVSNPDNPVYKATNSLSFVLGGATPGRFGATATVAHESIAPFDLRECRFTLTFTPYGSQLLSIFGMSNPVKFRRVKVITMPHYRRAVIL